MSNGGIASSLEDGDYDGRMIGVQGENVVRRSWWEKALL
jgi:hypothetical protein